jgi:hypothetical protein
MMGEPAKAPLAHEELDRVRLVSSRIVAFVILCACNKVSTSDARPAPSASVQSKPAAKVTVDGSDFPTSHAMIQTTETGLQLHVGEGSTCKEFKEHMFLTRAKHVLVDLGPAQNGVAPATGVWHGPPFNVDPGGTVTIHGDVATASTVDVDLAVSSKEAKLEMRGSVSAEVCR